MSSHDDHAIEPQPTISKMDAIWAALAVGLAIFAFTFICFNAFYIELGRTIWSHIGWII